MKTFTRTSFGAFFDQVSEGTEFRVISRLDVERVFVVSRRHEDGGLEISYEGDVLLGGPFRWDSEEVSLVGNTGDVADTPWFLRGYSIKEIRVMVQESSGMSPEEAGLSHALNILINQGILCDVSRTA